MGRGSAELQQADAPRRAIDLRRASPEEICALVDAAAVRLSHLGEWPDHVDRASLAGRVPTSERQASGFDAGIACALDLIPRDRQELAARLHAAYTPSAIAQVRAEAVEMEPDSETCWWASACAVCEEGRLGVDDFRAQIEAFEALRLDPDARRASALAEINAMRNRYEMRDGLPFSVEDGGMQGAYVDGHLVAVMHEPEEDIYFIGTFERTLGLEGFEWGADLDDLGRPRSGPVHGSRQFVRCGSREELSRAVEELLPGLLPDRPLYHVAPRAHHDHIVYDGGLWAGESPDLDERGVYVFSNLGEARRFQANHPELGDTDIWQFHVEAEEGLALAPDPQERCGWRHEAQFLEVSRLELID